MSKHRNGHNGHGKPVTSLSERMESIQLAKGESEQIAMLDKNLAQLKIALADCACQVKGLENKRDEIIAAIAKASEAYIQRVMAAATDHGIDKNDTQKKWNFDGVEMKFTRTA